ncbi:3-oxoacyl-(acyl-carrier-protein) synthase [Fibrella aestuarina BUZ 2]|uniref:3-oxoacyl-[acyl-carrier-protein] synthase 2 n=1 Tax=Fibrella aestuarina BUZ 2 TaxID=1166018 RepID=I0KFM7_9BACT|nr:beta-ketoacyl-ACP synthase II [Fibrella aestuarina]CCH02930.1 3-oxoacyl-(acyl-carrier-protein) synthase [Fibrella aestuarina BUZ 2]
MELKRVVVTGLGALTPIGNTVADFWQGLSTGTSGAAPITKFDATLFKTRFACEVKGFDPLNYFDRKEARKMDGYVHYAIVTADQAIEDAGLLSEGINKERVGVIWASGIGGLHSFQEEVLAYGAGNKVPRFSPFFIPKMIADMGAGLISIRHGFMGVNFAPVSACASSTHALIDAFNYIRLGKADAIVTGGSEYVITDSALGGFSNMKALSERNDEPQRASRPFDADRDGFVLGEGGGGIILEDYDHAKARGAKIYCELVGTGATADAYHMTGTHPEGLGAANAMREALREAGLQPDQIDYLNVHATSTPIGDVSEAKAIVKVFGENPTNLNISATKSMTGHLLGAAGAIEGVAGILAMQHNLIPPTINLENRDENVPAGLNLTPNVAQAKPVNTVMSNTFGFGGHNATVLFKRLEA